MKSAYELAMSRLEKTAPTVKLSAEKKAALAEIDSEIDAKIAERRVFLEDQIARARGNPAEADQLRKELADDLRRLEEKRESKKEKVRNPS